MPLPARVSLILAASLLGGSLWAAPALPVDAAAASAELKAIEALSERSAPDALRRLETLKASLGEEAPYQLRSELLRKEARLRQHTGELELSYAAERTALQLAIAHRDTVGALRARLGLVRQLVDQNRNTDAQAELDRIGKEVPANAPRSLLDALEDARGDLLNARSEPEKALAAYLRALKRAADHPEAGERRAFLQSRIAQMYNNTDNPEKALETLRPALLQPGLPARTLGELHFMQGVALVYLERNAEALVAFRRALELAEQGGLRVLEAYVRGNLADFHLRQEEYVAAERESRLALAVSTRVNDQHLVMMAKANLGFALMGQERMSEGLPHVDGVIDALRKGEAWADVEAMYDEKTRMLKRAGLYKEALDSALQLQELRRSRDRIARDRAIATLQEEFNASQRTRQIEFLNRENAIKEAELHSRRTAQIVTTFAALLTVLGGAVVFVLYRRARRSALRLRELNTQLEYHSMRDALTGLYNRRSFLEKMAARANVAEGDRRRGSPEDVDCFVLMDIDHFKQINDRWGHAVGDAVLVEVARRLGASVRDSDMVLRWGGEEFLVYAPGTHPAHIADLVGRILAAIGSAPVDAGTCSVPVTLSAGVVSLPAGVRQDGDDWQRAMRLADWALYQGKAGGRNQARIVACAAAPLEAVLASVEGAQQGEVPAGLVDMVVVRGPAGRETGKVPEGDAALA